ncbi:MAG: hypothetical protein FWG74_03305, partial [Planctomycetes bacterium]|nr:hypothetical protein [Planctomycetota bacterium]
MDADSAGRRLSLSAHPGGIPPENAGGPTIPDPQVGKCEAGDRPPAVGCLWREGGKVMYQAFAGDAPKAVRVVWVKPLSGRGGAVSILLAGKKREAAFFASLDDIPADSRALVVE